MRLLGHRESLNMDFERQFLSSLKARTLEYSLEYRSVPTSSGSVLGLRQTPAVGNAESQSPWRPVETALALTVRCAIRFGVGRESLGCTKRTIWRRCIRT